MSARRVDGLLIERPAGELLVLKPATSEAHALNETAAIVFDLCDGTTSRDAMVAEVARRTGLPADPGIVDLALGELTDAGLVTLDAPGAGLSRRSLIRRLALPVAGIALLPVVETILMPSVTSGQSALTPPSLPPPSSGFFSGRVIPLPTASVADA